MRLSSYVIGILALVFLNAQLAVAQWITGGVKGGVQIADDISGGARPESKRYIAGPMLEVHLPWRLSFEFDALYRRFGLTRYSTHPPDVLYQILRERANSWEFPMIVKYHFAAKSVHPFVGVGYAPRTVLRGSQVLSGAYATGISGDPPHYTYTYDINVHIDTNYPVTHGIVGSAGVDFGVGHIRVSPELRYVHWGGHFFDTFDYKGPTGNGVHSALDECFVLLGISWR